MRRLTILLCLLASQSLANPACHDLWYTRNALFDRAGYCFGSVLGQSVFGNQGCIGKNVALSPQAKADVAEAKRMEAWIGCRVNTGGTFLDLPDFPLRRQMVDLPVLDEFEFGCLGWVGPPTDLRVGAGFHHPAISSVQAGNYVSFSHRPIGGWHYVTVHGPNFQDLKGAGWLPAFEPDYPCRDFAG